MNRFKQFEKDEKKTETTAYYTVQTVCHRLFPVYFDSESLRT